MNVDAFNGICGIGTWVTILYGGACHGTKTTSRAQFRGSKLESGIWVANPTEGHPNIWCSLNDLYPVVAPPEDQEQKPEPVRGPEPEQSKSCVGCKYLYCENTHRKNYQGVLCALDNNLNLGTELPDDWHEPTSKCPELDDSRCTEYLAGETMELPEDIMCGPADYLEDQDQIAAISAHAGRGPHGGHQCTDAQIEEKIKGFAKKNATGPALWHMAQAARWISANKQAKP